MAYWYMYIVFPNEDALDSRWVFGNLTEAFCDGWGYEGVLIRGFSVFPSCAHRFGVCINTTTKENCWSPIVLGILNTGGGWNWWPLDLQSMTLTYTPWGTPGIWIGDHIKTYRLTSVFQESQIRNQFPLIKDDSRQRYLKIVKSNL